MSDVEIIFIEAESIFLSVGEQGPSAGDGSVSWGDLDGTLSDQADLQAALDAKADTSSLAAVATSGAHSALSGIGTNTHAQIDTALTRLANTSGNNTGDETGARVATLLHAATAKTTLVDADEVSGTDSANSYSLIRTTWANVWVYIKSKADAVYQAAGSYVLQSTTVNGQALSSNVTVTTITGNAGTATALQTARNIDGQSFDGTASITVIAPGTHAATSKTTPVDADELPIVDSAASNTLKKLTWANLKATLKTYLDTLYTAIGIVPNTPPAAGEILIGNAGGTAYAKQALTGDVTISSAGVTAIGAGKVTEAMQVLADNTTNNVSTTKHGYAPKAPNDATKYLDGTGAYSTPAGSGGLTIGTTAITSGTSTRLLYDNAGVVGESTATTDSSGNLTIPSGAKLHANAADSAVAIDFGGTTNSFPALRYVGAQLEVVQAGLSNWASLKVAGLTTTLAINLQTSAQVGSPASAVVNVLNATGTAYANFRGGNYELYGLSNTTLDLGITRNAAGVAEVNNGTAGTLRDLKLRNLIGTGNLQTGTVSKSADYTATVNDGTIAVDASGAGRTITLFAASGNAGKIIVVYKSDSSGNSVTVAGNGAETIAVDGSGASNTVTLGTQYNVIILQVNPGATGWIMLQNF